MTITRRLLAATQRISWISLILLITGCGTGNDVLSEHRDLVEATGGDACLTWSDGEMVQSWYREDADGEPWYAMSMTKSVASLLIGILMDQGHITGLDDPILDYLPDWNTQGWGGITLGHLLSMTAGFPAFDQDGIGFREDKEAFLETIVPTDAPGTVWRYSNEAAGLLSPIIANAAGEKVEDFAQRVLFEPLGMVDTRIHVYPEGQGWTHAALETTPEDFLKIGILMLSDGLWGGRRIVSQAWVEQSTRPSQEVFPDYGLMWWLFPDQACYAAVGYLDNVLYVFPERDTVILRMQKEPAAGIPPGRYQRRTAELFADWVGTP